jgi:hypothetical protein
VFDVEFSELFLPLVQLPIERADLAEIAAFEAGELIAKVSESEFTRRER